MAIRNYIIVAGVAAGCLLGGCANHHKVQRAPSMVKEKEVPAGPEQKGFFTRAGETTMDVVTAPVRMVTPQKKVKKEPEKWEPAEVIMMGPEPVEVEANGEAGTQPGK